MVQAKKKKAKKTVKKAKVVKKKASKKKTAKKQAKASNNNKPSIIEVTIKKRFLGKAPKEYHFVLADGGKIESVMGLANAFRAMSEEVFSTHVNDMRNDFANWVHDVFDEPDFAEELRRINNKVDAEIITLRKLIEEMREIKKKL
jgi:hypothetical protein